MSKADLPEADILDLPPEQAVVILLKRANPSAAEQLRAKIETIAGALADLVEEARTSTLRLDHFLSRAATLLGERRTVDEQLRWLGETPPVRAHPANEVLDLVRAVARFRNLAQLRAHRPGLIEKLERDLEALDHADFGLRSLLAATPNAYYAPRTFEWVDKVVSMLRKRQDLVDRLRQLDPRGNAGRAALVRDAVARHGGADHLVAALAPTLPSAAADKIPATEREIAALDQELAITDPESRKAAQLQERRQQAKDSLPALRKAVVDEQAAAARASVSRALGRAHGGWFSDVAELAALASAAGKHELAKDVDAAHSEDGVAVYVVAELIG